MRWVGLLFAHWRLPAATLRPLIPPGLEVDEIDGSAWLAIVPFQMARVGPKGVALPGPLGNFGEINVRTYVTPTDPLAGPPGIWFLSLDAANPLVVAGARAVFHLPYYRAQFQIQTRNDGTIDYRSRRTQRGAQPATFSGHYRGIGTPATATPGSLIDRLTARFALYSADRRGRLHRGDIRHRAWCLSDAEAELDGTSFAAAGGVRLPDDVPLLHLAETLDVVAALPVTARRG
jgi:uncharacterized protein YqjF (DUF2071 family)